MRRQLALSLAFTALTSALAAGCDNPAANKPVASVSSAAPATGAAVAAVSAADTFTIDTASSKVGFVGSKITGSHTGSFSGVTGTIAVPGGKVDLARVDVEIDTSTVDTDTAKLTKHLKSGDFFDVATYPKARFTSTSIAAGGAAGATHTVTGTLDLRGVKKTISFPATLAVSGGDASAKAEFVINRKDFGIVYAGKQDDLIKDEVVIKLDIHAKKKG